MLKVLLIGLWVCFVSIGGVYLSAYMSQSSAATEAASPPVVTSIVRGASLSLPVINNGAVEGYFLGRISLSIDSEKAKKVQLPMDVILTDELFSLLMGDKMIDLKNVGSFDPEKFRTKIKDGINGKLHDAVVANVLIEQLDYMSKETIKANSSHRSNNAIPAQKIVEGVVVETKPAASH